MSPGTRVVEAATELLWWMASHVPRDAELPLARAHSQALLTIAFTHRNNNTQDTYYQRTQLANVVYRDVIDHWSASDDRKLHGNVAYAMTQRAIALTELGDDLPHASIFGRVPDSYGDATLPAERDIARQPLSPNDLVLARFPTVMRVEDVLRRDRGTVRSCARSPNPSMRSHGFR